jgi:mono/diheme cytochrome c family protein
MNHLINKAVARLTAGLALTGAAIAAGCSNDGPGERPSEAPATDQPAISGGTNDAHSATAAALARLPKGPEQREKLCGRGHRDAVTQVFCRDGAAVRSLAELKDALGLATAPYAATTQSSSLATRFTTPANPRVIFVDATPDESEPKEFSNYVGEIGRLKVALAFVRGEPFLEIVAWDRARAAYDFYLLAFDLPCATTPGGCTLTDLFTDRVESSWTGTTLYEDEDLEDTIFACSTCHQPKGSSQKLLLMREPQEPWLHWMHAPGSAFGVQTKEGQTIEEAKRELRFPSFALESAFESSHPDNESYAGVPARGFAMASAPELLERVIELSQTVPQPIVLDSRAVYDEVLASSPKQPYENVPAGVSPTWEKLFEQSLRGPVLPLPYHDLFATDPGRFETYRSAYLSVMAKAPGATLPDPTQIFLETASYKLGFATPPGLSGREVLHRACSQCHNADVPSTSRRAVFDPDRLSTLPRSVLDSAIARLRLPEDDPFKMPPSLFRTLSHEAIEAALAELRAPSRP